MAYLLDTHTFLWFVSGDNQLPEKAKKVIEDMQQACFLSVASLWEITIKLQNQKLELGVSLKELFEFIERNQIEIIPVNMEHLLLLSNLPMHHNDPFDRLIVCQSISEGLVLISKDKQLKYYPVELLWN
jgi:PIN domain nuclease of toxin-antitoxin system